MRLPCIRADLGTIDGINKLIEDTADLTVDLFEKMEGMEMEKLPMVWMEPDAVASKGLAALPGRRSVIPGIVNTIMAFMTARLLPRSWAAKMFGSMMGSVMSDEMKDAKLNQDLPTTA